MTKNVPAVKKSQELVASQVPDDIDFDSDIKDLGAHYLPEQMAIPFLTILQALSPQVTRGKDVYIPEAKPGELFNTVTKELYDGEKGINIIFGNFKESYIEWVPRSEGGGFVHEYKSLEGSKIKVAIDPSNNRVITDDSPVGTPGNHLNLTHTRLGFIVSDDYTRWTPTVVSMTASQLKVSSSFNTRHTMLEYEHPTTGEIKKGPPLPYILWSLKSKSAQNKQGQPYFAWDIEFKTLLQHIPDNQGWNLYKDIVSFVRSSQGKKAMDNVAREMDKQLKGETETELNDEIPF